MNNYKIWIIDNVEPEGGFWWNCFEDEKGFLRQVGFDYKDETELDTFDWYIKNGYKIEKR